MEEALDEVGEHRRGDLLWIDEKPKETEPATTTEGKSSLELMWKSPQPQVENTITRRLIGFKSKVAVKRIDHSLKQGSRLLTNLRDLEAQFGLEGSFSFAV